VSAQQVTGLLSAILGVQTVKEVSFGPLEPGDAPFVSELKIDLADGRRALYRFAATAPIELASYTLSIDSGLWTESQSLSIIPVRRAILALDALGAISTLKWERKP
jgi:hypothetical protein